MSKRKERFKNPTVVTMEKYGHYAVRSEESAERMKCIKDDIVARMAETIWKETPEKSVQELWDKWNDVVGTIRYAGIPYLRGGSEAKSGTLIFLFEQLDGLAQTALSIMLEMVREYVEFETIRAKKRRELLGQEDAEGKKLRMSWEHVRKAENFMSMEFFPWALGISGVSWRDQDLTEKQVFAIQLPKAPSEGFDLNRFDEAPRGGPEQSTPRD